MNPFAIAGGAVEIISLALKRPFITASGRKDASRNAVLRVRLKSGGEGFGEACSSLAMIRHTPEMLAAELRGLLARFRGRDVRRWRELAADTWKACPLPAAAAAFECALLEALLSRLDVPMAEWFGGACSRLETDMTISAASAAEAAAAAREAAGEGFRRFKVKVTGDARSDLARVLAVREAGRRPTILLDGNQGMTVRSAIALTEACLKRGVRVDLLEQPLPREDLAGMARLKSRSPVPVAADESARSVEDVLRLLDRDAADVINVKVAKTGLAASLEIIALARAAGKRLMIGCMSESARGLSASVHLALGTGAFSFVDLDWDVLLAEGPPGTFKRRGPYLSVS